MPLASLFALALMTAEPAAAAPSPTPSPVEQEPLPAGAPSDDFGLVNWCAGALSGHMMLYHMVKPELDALPDPSPKETAALDAAQIKAGREYLELYKKAIEAAERASPRSIAEQGRDMRRQGNSIWNAARSTTDAKARMWTYLGWELPGRCETSAERLYEKSLLSAQALGIDLIGGASAASDKPVTPQIDAASTPSAKATPAPAASTLPIEEQFQADVDGSATLPGA